LEWSPNLQAIVAWITLLITGNENSEVVGFTPNVFRFKPDHFLASLPTLLRFRSSLLSESLLYYLPKLLR